MGKTSAIKGALEAATSAVKRRARPGQTVKEPYRLAYPGIYKRPDELAREAAERVSPESPNLKRLFGVTREDLYQMGKGRKGNLPGDLPGASAKPRGSQAARNVMNKRNEQRLLDALAEAEKYPELVRGMDPWYVMDPLYQKFVAELGEEAGKREYMLQNRLMGMASSGSEVTTEIPRGSAAYYMHKQGRFPEFVEYGGVPFSKRGADYPEELLTMPSHPYHSTSHAKPMQALLETGEMQMESPKVPMYIEASGVPETGFQTATPVGDAHWSRAVGLADTRAPKRIKGEEIVPGASVTNPEMSTLKPWWQEKIAGEAGLESVPAQARTWGVFSPQTGVTTPIGAPKLELLADQAVLAGMRLGISPEEALSMYIRGQLRLGRKEGGAVSIED